ncbi:restriction endonuclease subunit S [Acidovorax carolinensis]|uniref:restriction endonuclease subunit S n=1 Tax=Acidovorax carolinensis TaxID=553814 RepID=UPI00138FAA07|nr:restriction endonuclease subunit S [Acidovorax carolinensis]
MLLSNLDLLATAPGGVARLRELILTLAVQGKLVPQDPADEPAGVLLKKIRAEKDRLIVEGKIKRDKPLAEIAEEEKPFGLPVGWEWVRALDICALVTDGDHQPPPKADSGVPFLVIGDVRAGVIALEGASRFVPDSYFEELDWGKKPCPGDVLYTTVGSFGIPVPVIATQRFCFQRHIALFRPAIAGLQSYLATAFRTRFVFAQAERGATGIAQKTVPLSVLRDLSLPLPPLPEQSRIVTRVEELMRLCDALEAKGRLEAAQHAQLVSTLLGALTASTTPEELAENWQRVAQHFDLLAGRPEAIDALEQTLLQLAVRGLLVPQDPADEPASVLLKKIRAEKDRLIAAGQIKRDKPLPPITDEEKPFELPVGWEWARFPDLGQFGRGKSKHRPRNDPALFNPPIYPVVQTGEVARAKGVIQEYHSKYSDVGLTQSRLWPKGTLCITIAANIADAAVLGFDACFPDSVVGFVPADAIGDASYFLAFMETARTQLIAFAPATAQKNINLEILESVLIPIPPLVEMSRIVTRVTALRRLCADLRQRLAEREAVQARLAEALVHEVSLA